MTDTQMYEVRVDPIRYAWERCNRRVSFPSVLSKSAGPAASLGGPLSLSYTPTLAQSASGPTIVQRALHSLIVGPPVSSKTTT